MTQILPYIQIVLSVLLVAAVLLQRSENDLGASFGGDGSTGGRFTRRGFEKLLFKSTIVIAILFCLSAIAPLLLAR